CSPTTYLICTLMFTYLASFFFFTDTSTTEIYTLSLHDALPICRVPSAWIRTSLPSRSSRPCRRAAHTTVPRARTPKLLRRAPPRSEEHTSELQSRENLVCRLLLEKKKN